jgi:hypothetical protein
MQSESERQLAQSSIDLHLRHYEGGAEARPRNGYIQSLTGF